ncbi:AAA family ATPase [Actinomadura parmotrematis]|uniref:MoxR family ATPase n=1 Tax=Actinomadura parmotrematis TaxID=2864039 RepID=A0ABS7G307_9ACTN|nr:MoxR family ATPase [Actinomadura parmotrematis]MBW8486851.1 MoxR family ATPase [Actinomadura parmotrematis]
MSADQPPGRPAAAPRDGNGGGPPAGERPPAWWLYHGTGRPRPDFDLRRELPAPPPWRTFGGGDPQPPPPEDDDFARRLGPVENLRPTAADRAEIEAVNAALLLRRPLLVTGPPGVGKSSLAYRISRELRLGRVLRWPISSRSTLAGGLHAYDAVGRVQAAAAERAERRKNDTETDIGDFLRLGPLGTALLPHALPRVLLIDELDKSDIDLPNDLLDVLEEGHFRIPELERVSGNFPQVKVHTADPGVRALVRNGHVQCAEFPLIVITSNGERAFPPALRRRCLHFEMEEPDEERLADMVAAHFSGHAGPDVQRMVADFLRQRRARGGLAIDQLLNAAYLLRSGTGAETDEAGFRRILDLIWQRLNDVELKAVE